MVIGECMKILFTLAMVASTLLTGCIVAEPRYQDQGQGQVRRDSDRDGIRDRAYRDRDGDGVPNRQDRRPDDPRRY